ncbi:hypothetical protein [Nonomuraea sp. NPDC003201]
MPEPNPLWTARASATGMDRLAAVSTTRQRSSCGLVDVINLEFEPHSLL